MKDECDCVIGLHEAKNLAEITRRMVERSIGLARDAEFVERILQDKVRLKEQNHAGLDIKKLDGKNSWIESDPPEPA